MSSKTKALKESLFDTIFATTITVPVNYLLAYIAVKYSWTPLEITVYFTSVFFAIAVYRKYRVRLYFEKRNRRIRNAL